MFAIVARRCAHAVAVLALLLWWASPSPEAKVHAAATVSDDAVATAINTAVSFNVLENDGKGLKVVGHGPVSHGELTTDKAGNFEYLPHANFIGADAFTYTVEDKAGARSTAVVSIEVTGEATSVEARNDRAETDEDTPIWLSVRANDGAGPDNLPLTITIEVAPAHGEAVLQGDGSLVYTPGANWHGSDELRYTITDGDTTDAATVSIDVASVPDAPDAVDDAMLTDQGQPVEIEVLANDWEPDGDGFTFVEHSTPLAGTVRWSDGERMMTYEPNPDFFGADSFTYTIADQDGADTATVSITVDGNPAGQDDIAIASAGIAEAIDVLANDADPEAQPLTITSVTRPRHGEASINQDLTIRYVPDSEYTGRDSFSYTVADPRGNTSRATVTVDVAPVGNFAPVAVDDEYIIEEDSPGNTLDVLTNDSDPDNNPLTISIDRSPEHGDITVGANQVVIYTPDPGFSGTDTFVYSISDGISGVDSAKVTLIVRPVNDMPVAAADEFAISEDAETVLDVLANDSDPDDDMLVLVRVDYPSIGTATIDERGQLVYRPNENASGQDSFAYELSDGRGGSASATVTITVNPVNDSPDANRDRVKTKVDAPVEIAVLANDSDPDNASLGVAIETGPRNGTAVITGASTIRYSPNKGYEGVERFTYSAVDINGAYGTATVLVIVGEPDLAPVAVKDDARTSAGSDVRIKVLENDMSPIDSRLTISETSAPEHGTVRISKGTAVVYTPDAGYVGRDSFTYTVTDTDGRTDKVRVYINVRPADD